MGFHSDLIWWAGIDIGHNFPPRLQSNREGGRDTDTYASNYPQEGWLPFLDLRNYAGCLFSKILRNSIKICLKIGNLRVIPLFSSPRKGGGGYPSMVV